MPSTSDDLPKVVLIHPGTQYSFGLAIELYRRNLLQKYITSFCVSQDSLLFALMKDKLHNRVLKEVPRSIVKNYPRFEVVAYMRGLAGAGSQEDILYQRNLAFQDAVLRSDLDDAQVVIGFDTSSWKLAEYCLRKGKKFILDVSIGHPLEKEAMFEKIRDRFPEWADIAQPKRKDLIDLELTEFNLASAIVVPSHFVKQTLVNQGVEGAKIHINQFGRDTSSFGAVVRKRRGNKVTFLFFGSLTARKGLPLLLEAWKILDCKNAELIIAGYGQIPQTVELGHNVRLIGSVSGPDRNALFAMAHVFVFPSYFEGLALVQLEAAASGLPVIGTTNSGAEEIVKHGYNGFVLEPGNSNELAKAMKYFVINPSEIEIMSERIKEGIDFFSWNTYGDRWKQILTQVGLPENIS